MVWRWTAQTSEGKSSLHAIVTGAEAQAEEIINATFRKREEYVNRKFDGGLDKRDFERLYNIRLAVRAGYFNEG